ncbi:MAG TPA: thioredoxin family protein [Pirellulaceae bacterium]|nr:thioredoxin family protein [Pirellulaceae bacterium]
MRGSFVITACCLAMLLPAVAGAGKYNPVLKIGEPAPDYSGLEGIDGKQHALKDLAEKQVVVVAFICNTCDYAKDAEERLIALADKFAAEGGKCALVAINPNLIKDDLLPAMQERAKLREFNFLYVHDGEKQETAKAYGITYTPEFVVLDKDGKVVYLGALDDDPDGKKVTTRYVEDAVAAALAGKQPATAETPARGCAVRQPPRRRRTE